MTLDYVVKYWSCHGCCYNFIYLALSGFISFLPQMVLTYLWRKYCAIITWSGIALLLSHACFSLPFLYTYCSWHLFKSMLTFWRICLILFFPFFLSKAWAVCVKPVCGTSIQITEGWVFLWLDQCSSPYRCTAKPSLLGMLLAHWNTSEKQYMETIFKSKLMGGHKNSYNESK